MGCQNNLLVEVGQQWLVEKATFSIRLACVPEQCLSRPRGVTNTRSEVIELAEDDDRTEGTERIG